MGSLIRFSVIIPILSLLFISTLPLTAQERDLRAERLVLDDDNGNTLILQTPPGPITGGTLVIPDPAGSGRFLISNPAGGSQSISGDLLPGTDNMYDLGSGALRWQDIFAAGLFSLGGQLQFVETGGGTDYVGFQAPAAVTASQIWTLPAADGGVGQALITDGAGNLNWANAGIVSTNATLIGNGSPGSPLGINLGNSNTWTANQTFGGTFLITSNSRIAMTNSDNNARDIRLQEPSGTGTQYIGIRAPSVTNNGNYVWPAVVGSAGQVMAINASNGIDSATMHWITPTASGAAGGDLTGTYPNPTIAADAITSAKILDGQVQNSDISANAITTSKVANGTVTTSKMADSAISGLKLLTFAVTNRHLAANAVTPDKVSPTGAASGDVLTYNGANVVWGAPTLPPVTGAMILDSTITTADISPTAAIPYSKLVLTNSIQNSDIVANAITTSKVANGTVTTSKMADSAISGLKLLTFAVTNRHLAANAVTPDKVSPTGAASGDILTYDGTNVVWGAPAADTVTHNATLTGNGTGASPLAINLGNWNTWTSNQTFAGMFLITANSRIAMTNSDNNARDIRLQEPSGTGTQYIGIRAPNLSNNGNYVWPAVVGTAGQVLTIQSSNNGVGTGFMDSATLVWSTVGAAGITGDSTLIGNGTGGSPLGIDLAQTNVWTAPISTFAGFLESRNEPFVVTNTDNSANEIRIQEASGNGSNYVAFRADTSISTNDIWILPSTAGTAGQVLGITAVNTPSNRFYTLDWTTPAAAPVFARSDQAVTSGNATLNASGVSLIRVTGSTGAFTLVGMSGGTDGKMVVVVNQTGNNMTVSFNDVAEGTAANRLDDAGSAPGATGTIATTAEGSATFVYDGGQNRWVLLDIRP